MKTQHPYDSRHLKQVLHRNEMEEFIAGAKAWMQSHLEAVLIGAVVLAAAAFGVVFFVKGQREKALDASKALNEAQSLFQQAGTLVGPEAATAYNQAYAKYQGVASAYDGLPQAQAARLGQANALLAQGKAADAERDYAALDSRHDNPIAALAAYGRARALEMQGQSTAAAQAYLAAAQAYPDSAVVGAALAAARRLSPVAEAKKG